MCVHVSLVKYPLAIFWISSKKLLPPLAVLLYTARATPVIPRFVSCDN